MPHEWKKTVALLVSSCLGAGYVPIAPGTAGSLLALPLKWGLEQAGGFFALLGGLMVVIGAGFWAVGVAETHYRVHDCRHIVVDELAGQLLAVLLIPCRWPYLIVAFGWFRLFDALKPWPIGWIDRQVPGAVGVMLDDLLAAIYAAALTALMIFSGVIDGLWGRLI